MDPINPAIIQPSLLTGTTGTTYTGPYSTTPTTGVTAGKNPGKGEFLQLLVAQLRAQDPLNPMEDREFITQLAQFNALEEMQKLNTSVTAFSAAQDVQIAQALLGKTVLYLDVDGTAHNGQVSEVGWYTGIPKLLIDDKEVDLGQIVSVR